MLKKTRHQRRVEFGKWLETLLNPNISKWEIYSLLQQAVTLLGIEFQIDKKHSFFYLIENIQLNEGESLHNGIRRCYSDLFHFITNLSSTRSEYNTSIEYDKYDFDELQKSELQTFESQRKVKWEDLPLMESQKPFSANSNEHLLKFFKHQDAYYSTNNDIREQLSKKFKVKHNISPASQPIGKKHRLRKRYQEEVHNSPELIRFDTRVFPYMPLMDSISNVLSFSSQISTVETLLKKIHEQGKPWEISIPIICKQGKPRENWSFEFFIEAYSSISDNLHIKEGILVFERTLAQRFAPVAITNATENTSLQMVTKAFLSNILFDFLLLDGQEYYGFCEYCSKFFAIERKGRKKFCSDICRTMNQRQ